MPLKDPASAQSSDTVCRGFKLPSVLTCSGAAGQVPLKDLASVPASAWRVLRKSSSVQVLTPHVQAYVQSTHCRSCGAGLCMAV